MSEQGPRHARIGPLQICPGSAAISPRHGLELQAAGKAALSAAGNSAPGMWRAMLRNWSGH